MLFVEDTGAGAGEFHSGRLKDLSIDGLRLATAQAFPEGARLYLGIFLRDAREPLVALASVLHCEPSGADVSLGLQFLCISLEQRRAIERLARYLSEHHGATADDDTRKTEALVRQTRDEAWWQ